MNKLTKKKPKRKNGRDDFPVRAMWNSVLAGIVFQHISAESLRRELSRNAQLRYMCGFYGIGKKAIPAEWVYTRFLKKLIKHLEEIEEMFKVLVEELRIESLKNPRFVTGNYLT